MSYLTMSQAAKLFGPSRDGAAVHPATVTRWIRFGARSIDGAHIRLRAVRLPGGWRTTQDAIDEFLARSTGAALGEPVEPAQAPQTKARQAELAQVDAELEAAGI